MKHLKCVMMSVVLVLLLSFTVQSACTVSTTSIIFADYDFLATAPASSTGSITLSCTKKSNVTIDIGASSNSGAFSPRRMKHAAFADTLDYNLYTSAAMTQVWGDDTNGTASVYFKGVSRSNIPPVYVYGRIVPLQNIPAGRYSEQLVVTITY